MIFEEYLPFNFSRKYDNYWIEIDKMKRPERYKPPYWLLGFSEKNIFKLLKLSCFL